MRLRDFNKTKQNVNNNSQISGMQPLDAFVQKFYYFIWRNFIKKKNTEQLLLMTRP